MHQEKIRISRDLHDNVGAYLSYLTFGIEKLGSLSDECRNKEEINKNLLNLKDFSNSAMLTLRETIWAISNEELSLEDLSDRFKSFALKLKEGRPELKVGFSENFEKNARLNPALALNLFRICREAFGNAVKHSGADIINVSFDFTKGILKVEIGDNGKGITSSETGDLHYGMKNMASRAD